MTTQRVTHADELTEELLTVRDELGRYGAHVDAGVPDTPAGLAAALDHERHRLAVLRAHA